MPCHAMMQAQQDQPERRKDDWGWKRRRRQNTVVTSGIGLSSVVERGGARCMRWPVEFDNLVRLVQDSAALP